MPDSIYDFLSGAGTQTEANLQPPVRIRLPDDADPQKIKSGLEALNPRCSCVVVDGGLDVFLPPRTRVGADPFDLRELAFVLKTERDVDELGLPGEWEHCCGDGGGCCANKG